MLVPMVRLVPSPEEVLSLLRETGALREGHFEYPDGTHSSLFFQIPLAMRYHGNARVLNVALSRLLRSEPDVLSALPDCAIVAPASGGIPVAFGVREALEANQIFWAEKKGDNTYHFRQYQDASGLKCILLDDLVRSGNVINYMVDMIQSAGATIIAVATLVHYKKACLKIGKIPYLSLVTVDADFFSQEDCPMCKKGEPLTRAEEE